jgi:hypothetical protein
MDHEMAKCAIKWPLSHCTNCRRRITIISTRHGGTALAALASPPDERARAQGPAGRDAGGRRREADPAQFDTVPLTTTCVVKCLVIVQGVLQRF